MTIQQLETRTGLDRATIRFYEKEGLLTPKRLPNGYRDYSEEDACTLEKIALLRRLDLPLEAIRQVQSGALPLHLALERQEEELRRQLADKEQALRLSRQLQAERVTYARLEPDKYRAQLPPPAPIPQLVIKPAEPPAEPAAGHPWMRFLARSLDELIYALPAIVMLSYILPWWQSWQYKLHSAVMTVAAAVLMLVLEPLLLSTWGWTPGKWLMGLRLRQRKDEKLSFSDGIYRTGLVLFHGHGLKIPILDLVCGILCYRRSLPRNNIGGPPSPPQDQTWDENDYYYDLDPRPRWMRALVPVLHGALILLLVLFLWGQLQLPNRQDSLTVEQYVENVNHVLDHTYYDLTGYHLQPDGSLTDPAWMHCRQEIQTENGLVTAVIMEYPLWDPAMMILEPGALKGAAMVALGKADDYFNVDYRQLLEKGHAVQTVSGWRMEHTVLDLPEDFADRFELAAAEQSGNWVNYWNDTAEVPLSDPVPRLRMVIERVN